MKTPVKLATIGMWAAILAACGGSGSDCYVVANREYYTYERGVSDISDSCNSPPLTAPMLAGARRVVKDLATGSMTIMSQDGWDVLGTGPVPCNDGLLTVSAWQQDGGCYYQFTRSSRLTVTGDNHLRLEFTERRENRSSPSGSTCTPLSGACDISYTLDMTYP